MFHDIHLLNPLNQPWLLIGDFNCMYLSHKKYGGIPLAMRDILPLNQFQTSNALTPVPTTGSQYTWNNRKHERPRTFCTLDHCFFNYNTLLTWPTLVSHVLCPGLFDHSPLIAKWGMDPMKTFLPFKFFNLWTNHVDFDNVFLQG